MSTTEQYCFWDGPESQHPTCWSVEQVMNHYWDYWSNAMKERFGEDVHLTKGQCLEDWMIVNWAWRKDE